MRKYLLVIISFIIPVILSAQDYFKQGIFEFYEFKPNEVRVNPVNTKVTGKIVIPSYVTNAKTGKTYSVTRIGTFRWCDKITEVVIPSTVRDIGAFAQCSSLEKVVLPENLEVIKQNTFRSCVKLKDINLQNVKHIRENAFQTCTSLNNLNLETIERLDNFVFADCTALTDVELPNSLTNVQPSAIADGCTSHPRLLGCNSYRRILRKRRFKAILSNDYLTDRLLNTKF